MARRAEEHVGAKPSFLKNLSINITILTTYSLTQHNPYLLVLVTLPDLLCLLGDGIGHSLSMETNPRVKSKTLSWLDTNKIRSSKKIEILDIFLCLTSVTSAESLVTTISHRESFFREFSPI